MNETPVAVLTVTVTVSTGRDPGTDTPDAWEPAYDYVSVRDTEVTDVRLLDSPQRIAGFAGDFDDFDPDDLIADSVKKALRSAVSEDGD